MGKCSEVKFSSVHPELAAEQNEPDALAATKGQVSKPFKETMLRAGPTTLQLMSIALLSMSATFWDGQKSKAKTTKLDRHL